MELLWRVELENGATVTGSTLMQPGENRIVCELPDDTLKSVTGAMLWDTEPGERIFINGFQSWTYSPECGVKDRTPSFANAGRDARRILCLLAARRAFPAARLAR